MESWSRSFKVEVEVEAIHGEKFPTRAYTNMVSQYIDVYYNRIRLHAKLGYLSPEAFEANDVA
jgi:transposase InsO family protein